MFESVLLFHVPSFQAILVQAQVGGSRLCRLARINGSSTLSVDCGGNKSKRLDETDIPFWTRVALDWIHGTYYWSGDDQNYGAVGVYDIATKRRRVLFHGLRNQIRPSGIVVDPLAGYIFWADNARRSIVRADTDGRNLTVSIHGRCDDCIENWHKSYATTLKHRLLSFNR